MPKNGDIVSAKALGWNDEEVLTREQLLEIEPYEGPVDLEGTYVKWEVDGLVVHTVAGFEADPDTIEQIVAPAERSSVSARARLALKRSIVNNGTIE